MKEFLEQFPLYQEYLLTKDYKLGNEKYALKSDFDGAKFDYYCSNEEIIRPFELRLIKEVKPIRHNPESHNKTIPDDQFIDEKLNFTFEMIATCQSCKQNNVHFLFNVYSDKKISNIINNYSNIQLAKSHSYIFPDTNIFIQKVGCFPEKKVMIEKSISKHFDRETNNWLYKAKSLIDLNFGIGAFAYLRRIIEKELLKIITEIKSLPDSNSVGIGNLLDKYEENPNNYTIYENIFEFLPNSLRELGDNPIQLLYKKTSEGLHSLKEDICLERAQSIVTILEFTIKKINEEHSDIKEVKEAVKKLK